MTRNSIWLACYAVFGLAIASLVVLVIWGARHEQQRTNPPSEQGVLRTVVMHVIATRQPQRIALVSKTLSLSDRGVVNLSREDWAWDKARIAPSVRRDFKRANQTSLDIAVDFPDIVTLCSASDVGNTVEECSASSGRMILLLSRPGFDRRRCEAVVYMVISDAPLSGAVIFVSLSFVDGGWKVERETVLGMA